MSVYFCKFLLIPHFPKCSHVIGLILYIFTFYDIIIFRGNTSTPPTAYHDPPPHTLGVTTRPTRPGVSHIQADRSCDVSQQLNYLKTDLGQGNTADIE